MSKLEYLRRTDTSRAASVGTPVSGPDVIFITQTGNADSVDGYHASSNPTPGYLLALDIDGKFPASVLPGVGLSGAQARGHHGILYFAPTAYLAEQMTTTQEYIIVTAPVFDGTEKVILSHWRFENEAAWLIGEGEPYGLYIRYPVARAKAEVRGRATQAQPWPQWTEVISLGSTDDGGFIRAVSAESTDAPFVDMYETNADRSATWKLQLGRLSTVPETFKAYFSGNIDWDVFGLAAEDVYLSGGVYAKYGNIAGSLDISGMLKVKSEDTNADLTIGNTAGGWGLTMRNNEGRPVWMLVTPYTDAGGNQSDLAWIIESMGERAVYFRHDTAANDWILSIGGFDFRAGSFISPGAQLKIDSENERIEFGPVYIQAGDPGASVLLDWQGSGILGDVPGAVIPVWTDQYNFGDFRVYNWPTADLGTQVLRFRVSQTTGAVYHYGQTYLSDLVNFNYASGASIKNPATDTPDTWIQVMANGTTLYIPAYAAS